MPVATTRTHREVATRSVVVTAAAAVTADPPTAQAQTPHRQIIRPMAVPLASAERYDYGHPTLDPVATEQRRGGPPRAKRRLFPF